MATKQLNSVNPRNFREKIELLKKKEAASTANFAAAIRDAREIRQIAGACEPLQIKSLTVQNFLERSLSKAYSVPNVVSGASSFEAVEHRPEHFPPTRFDSEDAARPTTRNGPPQVLTSNANGHLMSLLNNPATPVDALNSEVSALGSPQDTRNPPNWSSSSNRDSIFPTCGTSVSHSSNPKNYRSTAEYSAALASEVQHNPGPVPMSLPYRRVQRYASGDQLPSTMSYSVSYNHHTHVGSSLSGQASTSFSAQMVAPSYIRDDPNIRSAPYTPPHHVPTGGRGLYTAQTSLASLNSSPYFVTQVMDPYQKSLCGQSLGTQYPVVSTRPEAPKEQNPLNSTSFNTNIDWRRVSSDSSIHHSLMSYPLKVADHVAPSESNVESGRAGIFIKRPETMRRQFPTEPGGVVQPGTYVQSDCYSSNAVPPVMASGKTPGTVSLPKSGISPLEEDVLPAKRPFTGTNVQSINVISPDHYTQMNDLSLEDPKVLLNQANEANLVSMVPGNINRPAMTVQPSNMADTLSIPPAALNADLCPHSENPSFIKPSDPREVVDNAELPGDQTSVSGLDSTELDRFLQIPAALFDSDGCERWAGRRDSCTMTAEVLSALGTATNDSPLSKCDPTILSDSSYSKFSAHSDVSVVAGASNSYYCHQPATANSLLDPNQTHSSNFQDVACKLGISMTPNDYQLLTNPRLAHYVTDETTETQLLG